MLVALSPVKWTQADVSFPLAIQDIHYAVLWSSLKTQWKYNNSLCATTLPNISLKCLS